MVAHSQSPLCRPQSCLPPRKRSWRPLSKQPPPVAVIRPLLRCRRPSPTAVLPAALRSPRGRPLPKLLKLSPHRQGGSLAWTTRSALTKVPLTRLSSPSRLSRPSYRSHLSHRLICPSPPPSNSRRRLPGGECVLTLNVAAMHRLLVTRGRRRALAAPLTRSEIPP